MMAKKIRNKWQMRNPTADAVSGYLTHFGKLDDLLSGLSTEDQLSLLIPKLSKVSIEGNIQFQNIVSRISDDWYFHVAYRNFLKDLGKTKSSKAKAKASRKTKSSRKS